MISADLLREARLRAGLTQKELARRIGRPQSQIARWESGHVEPSLETLQKVIRASGFELTYGLAFYLPFMHDRVRLGAELFGSVGLLAGTAGDADNAPLEWSLNGRLFFNDGHTAGRG